MISKPDWHKSKVKPYIHQISIECIEKISDCMGKYGKSEINVDTCFKIEEQILRDEIKYQEFLNFAIKNHTELFSYIASGIVNIRIHRDVEGKMWFGVG